MKFVSIIAHEFEMSEFSREWKKLRKIENDEFVKIARQKCTQEDFERFKEHDEKLSSYYFKRQRDLIKFTLDFVKMIQK